MKGNYLGSLSIFIVMISLRNLTLEALGIPDNILEVNEDIYNEMVKELESISSKKISSTPKYTVTVKGPFTISDFTFNSVSIKITIEKGPFKEVKITNANFQYSSGLEKQTKYKRIITSPSSLIDITLNLTISTPDNFYDTSTWGDIVNFLEGQDKVKAISTLAHELMHSFNNYKRSKATGLKQGTSAQDKIKYRSFLDSDTGIENIDLFLFYLYYTTYTENLVRPVEFAARLKSKNVTKKDFLQALREDGIYKRLKQARFLTYDIIVRSLLEDFTALDAIKEWLVKNKIDIDKKTDEEVVELFMDYVYNNVTVNRLELYAKYLDSNTPLTDFLGITQGQIKQDKQEAFNEIKSKLDKYKTAKEFFNAEEKVMKVNAKKTLRRLAKLYAYLP